MVAGYDVLNLSVFFGRKWHDERLPSLTVRFRNVSVLSFVWGYDVYLSDAKYA